MRACSPFAPATPRLYGRACGWHIDFRFRVPLPVESERGGDRSRQPVSPRRRSGGARRAPCGRGPLPAQVAPGQPLPSGPLPALPPFGGPCPASGLRAASPAAGPSAGRAARLCRGPGASRGGRSSRPNSHPEEEPCARVSAGAHVPKRGGQEWGPAFPAEGAVGLPGTPDPQGPGRASCLVRERPLEKKCACVSA